MFDNKFMNHKFIFENTDHGTYSFYSFFKAVKKEIGLLQDAIRSIEDVNGFFSAIRRKIYLLTQDAEKAGYDRAAKLIATGDTEFDLFRERCVNNDWYYEYSDDNAVWKAGKARTEALIKTAEEKGGLYLTYLNKVRSDLFNK